jgi:hypothetical protein
LEIEAVTPDERGQIMGQRDPAVYRRHYMPDFIDRDCQAIYLGTVPQDDLIRRVGRIPYNLKAPTALTDTQKSEIRNNPKLLRLYKRRQRVCKKIKEDFSSIKAAEGTPQYRKQQKLQARINKLKQNLNNNRLEQAIDDFWKMADTDAVNQQLQGIIPSAEVLTPSTIEYELKERATVAKLFFQCGDDLKELQLFHMRMEIIQNLVILCRRQETPHTSKKRRHYLLGNGGSENATKTPGNTAEVSPFIADSGVISRKTLYCPFCRCDDEAGPRKQNKLFSRIDALRKHVRVQHLEYMRPNERFICPYRGCTAPLENAMHFLNHAAVGHDLCL